MPRDTRHTLTGTLRSTQHGYALEIDDGGVWRLDVAGEWNAQGNMDRRVTVEGIRADFDLLDVHRLYITTRQQTH